MAKNKENYSILNKKMTKNPKNKTPLKTPQSTFSFVLGLFLLAFKKEL